MTFLNVCETKEDRDPVEFRCILNSTTQNERNRWRHLNYSRFWDKQTSLEPWQLIRASLLNESYHISTNPCLKGLKLSATRLKMLCRFKDSLIPFFKYLEWWKNTIIYCEWEYCIEPVSRKDVLSGCSFYCRICVLWLWQREHWGNVTTLHPCCICFFNTEIETPHRP